MPIPLGVLAVAGAGAAGGGGSYDLLETTVLGSSAASVTFSNLGNYSAYKHLQIRAVTRGDVATSDYNIKVTLNSDTGSNYAFHNIRGNGSTVTSAASTSQAFMAAFLTMGTSVADIWPAAVVDILDFNNANKNTTIRSLNGWAGSANAIHLRSGFWNNTAAVTTITLTPNSGNLITGSRISLYGYK
jgi:hypothetical protein